MTLYFTDYIILTASLGSGLVGLFTGFSGSLALLLASLGGGAVAKFGWDYAVKYLSEPGQRGLAVMVAILVVFGLIRALVRKLVAGVLDQPADAIFGFVVAAAFGCVISGGIMLVLGPNYLKCVDGPSTILSFFPLPM